MKAPGSNLALRAVVGSSAAILGALAIWTLGAEMLSGDPDAFPTGRTAAMRWSESRASAQAAATFGLVRGDLWTVAAVAAVAPRLVGGVPDADPAELDVDWQTARRAARLSPHDPRAWLALAALELQRKQRGPATLEALKMSYYTGSADTALAPARLWVASQAGAFGDPELRSLLELEIQRLVSRRPDLKPQLADIVRAAPKEGGETFRDLLRQADPRLSETLDEAGRETSRGKAGPSN